MARSDYTVVRVDPTQKIVWLVDNDSEGCKSVTNDAERVCAEIEKLYPGHRIIYRDSMGNWDEHVHHGGHFKHYAPARHKRIPA